MKVKLIEKSVVDLVVTGIDPVRVDKPSSHFDHETLPKEWVEPRLIAYNPPGNSKFGQETDALTVQVKCYVKTQPKGRSDLPMADLVDRVRAILDPTEGAAPIKIVDLAGTTVVGIFNVVTVAVDFQWDVTETFNEGEVAGLDVATVVFDGHVSAVRGDCTP